VRLIRVHEIDPALAHELADLQGGCEAAIPRIGHMHGDAGFPGTRCQQRIAERNQFRGVTAGAQALQKEQSLMLPAAIFAAEVDQ
jgi:hypothetical protein